MEKDESKYYENDHLIILCNLLEFFLHQMIFDSILYFQKKKLMENIRLMFRILNKDAL